MLILTQKPDASRVAGFTTWKGLGRFVRKGEHGIAIFAPCPFTREVAGDDGSPEVRSGIFFKAVHVFDVSQTDGQPLPELEVPSIDVAADSLLASLERVAGRRGITLVREDMPENMNGASKNGSIALRNGMVSGQEAKTLAHELAHEALHWTKGERIDRNTAELEAESVAYVVCCHFGLDVEVRASRYIALWGGDSKGLRESLERIASTARAMIDDVDALPADQALTVNVAERVSTVNVAERAVA